MRRNTVPCEKQEQVQCNINPCNKGWTARCINGKAVFHNEMQGITTAEPPSFLNEGAGLPAGWICCCDKATGKLYFMDLLTHRSSWRRPKCGTNFQPMVTNVTKDAPIAGNVRKDVAQPTLAPLFDPRYMSDGDELGSALPMPPAEPLLVGWKEHFDSSTNLTFYHNSEKGESTWERPYEVEPLHKHTLTFKPAVVSAQLGDYQGVVVLTCPKCSSVFHDRDVYVSHLKINSCGHTDSTTIDRNPHF